MRMDTEGAASIYLHHWRPESSINIAQKEVEPSIAISRFSRSKTIVNKGRTAGKKSGIHIFEVKQVVSQLTFLLSVRPYLMTQSKLNDVNEVIKLLRERPKILKLRKGVK